MDFVRRWSDKTEIGAGRFIGWLDITASKFYDWRERYGKVNEHNGWVPRAAGVGGGVLISSGARGSTTVRASGCLYQWEQASDG